MLESIEGYCCLIVSLTYNDNKINNNIIIIIINNINNN